MTDNNDPEKPWQDEETLRELYLEKGLSCAKIAERFDGITSAGIQYWKDKFDLKKSRSEAAQDRWIRNPDVPFYSTDKGYEVVYVRCCDASDLVLIHRLLAVAEHGFDALKDKDVHHKNEIPWDNRLSNLELMTRSEHAEHHYEEGALSAE